MYAFLVLGLIPGTNIQISFWAWILIVGMVLVAAKRYKPQLQLRLNTWWHQFDEGEATRQPLHANRLHLRGL